MTARKTRSRRCSPHTLAILAAFAQQPTQWQYGYDLVQLTGLSSGTLYPILMRLGDRGLMESRWKPSPERGRPPRHLYRLSPRGLGFAQLQLGEADYRRSPPLTAAHYA